jgi:AhpD family alkylhydroperoxidase
MELDEQTKKLIAVGASVACNCHPCLEYHLEKAQSMGLDPGLLEKAIETGRAVRKGAASSMDRLAAHLTDRNEAHVKVACSGTGCCG